MKNFTRLLCVLLASLSSSALFAQLDGGTYKVGNATDADYVTLTEAIDAAKLGLNGDVIFELDGDDVAGSKLFAAEGQQIAGINESIKTPYSVTIRPAVGTEVVFSGGVQVLGGSKNIIFDGRPGGEGTDRAMIIRKEDNAGGNGNTDAALAVYQTAGNVTIRYTDIESDLRYGIRCQGFQDRGDTLIVENNFITTSSSTGYIGDGGAEYIRTLFYGGDIIIRNNIMTGLKQSGSDGYNGGNNPEHVGVFIWHEGPRDHNVKHVFENNVVEITKNAAASTFTGGIRINGGRGYTKGDEFRFLHNTITINGDNGAGNSFGILRDSKDFASFDSTRFVVQNNIISNNITGGGNNTGLWLPSSDATVNAGATDLTNYTFGSNNISVAAGNTVAAWTLNFPENSVQAFATIDSWNAFSGAETPSTAEVPTFTDLTVTPPDYSLNVDPETEDWYLGVNVGVATDANGVSRRQIPAKGAYEVPGILEGTFVIAADANAIGSADYASIQDAMVDVASKGLKGDIILELQDLFTVQNLEIDNQGDPAFSTTIRPAAGAAVVFNGYIYVQGGGTENIIFDGRPGGEGTESGMTFRQTDNSASDLLFYRAGANNLTVKYVTFENDARWGLRGQFAQGDLVVENCVFTTSATGYTGEGGSEYLRTLFYNGDVSLKNNMFYGLKQGATSNECVGVFLATPAPWQGGAARTRELINNVIVVEKPAGVKFSGGIRLNARNGQYEGDVFKAYHNTIVVTGETNTYADADGLTFGIARDAKGRDYPANTFDVRNNIIINTVTNAGSEAAQQAAIWVATATDRDLDGAAGADLTTFTFDYNNIQTSGNIALIGTDDSNDATNVVAATLNDWNALNAGANTTTETVEFSDAASNDYSVSSEDADATWFIGTGELDVVNDILGEARSSSAPTKGAYEFEPVTLSAVGLLRSDLVVYPNPTNGEFSITFNNELGNQIGVAIFDQSGRRVAFKSFDQANKRDLKVNISELPKGLYFIKVSDGTNSISQRIIKD